MQKWMKNKWRNSFKASITKEVIGIRSRIIPDFKNLVKELPKILSRLIEIIERLNIQKIMILRDNRATRMSLRNGLRNSIKRDRNRLNQISSKMRKKVLQLVSKNSKGKDRHQLNKRVNSHRSKRKRHSRTWNLQNNSKNFNKARNTIFQR